MIRAKFDVIYDKSSSIYVEVEREIVFFRQANDSSNILTFEFLFVYALVNMSKT